MSATIIKMSDLVRAILRQHNASQAFDIDSESLNNREEYFAACNELMDIIGQHAIARGIFLFGLRQGVQQQKNAN